MKALGAWQITMTGEQNEYVFIRDRASEKGDEWKMRKAQWMEKRQEEMKLQETWKERENEWEIGGKGKIETMEEMTHCVTEKEASDWNNLWPLKRPRWSWKYRMKPY